MPTIIACSGFVDQSVRDMTSIAGFAEVFEVPLSVEIIKQNIVPLLQPALFDESLSPSFHLAHPLPPKISSKPYGHFLQELCEDYLSEIDENEEHKC